MTTSTTHSFATAPPAIRAAMLWADALRSMADQPSMHTGPTMPPELAAWRESFRRDDGEAFFTRSGWLDQASTDPAALAIVAERLRFCMWNDTRVDHGEPAMALVQPKGFDDPDGRLCIDAFKEITEVNEAVFSLARRDHNPDPGEAMADLYFTLEGLGMEFDPRLQESHERQRDELFDKSLSSREALEEAMPRLKALREAREIAAAAGAAGRSSVPSPSL